MVDFEDARKKETKIGKCDTKSWLTLKFGTDIVSLKGGFVLF